MDVEKCFGSICTLRYLQIIDVFEVVVQQLAKPSRQLITLNNQPNLQINYLQYSCICCLAKYVVCPFVNLTTLFINK